MDRVDTPFNPVRLRGRATVGISNETLGVQFAVNHTGSYENNLVTPAQKVDSWTTLDANFVYHFPQYAGRALSGTSLFVNIRNLLNREPPFLNNGFGIGYDPTNADSEGAVFFLGIRRRW